MDINKEMREFKDMKDVLRELSVQAKKISAIMAFSADLQKRLIVLEKSTKAKVTKAKTTTTTTKPKKKSK